MIIMPLKSPEPTNSLTEMKRALLLVSVLLLSVLPVWADAPAMDAKELLSGSDLTFKNDSELEAAYHKMLTVIAVVAAVFFVIFIANKKFKLFDGLVRSTSDSGLIGVKEVKRISPKTVVYILTIKGQDRVIVESVVNVDTLELSKEINGKNEV